MSEMTIEEAVRCLRAMRSNDPNIVSALCIIDHLTTQLAEARSSDAFARAEWAHWEAEACRIERERKALTADRDALAAIVERVRGDVANALREMPALNEGGGYIYPVLDGDGEYIGEQPIRDDDVIQMLVRSLHEILDALAAYAAHVPEVRDGE